MEYGASPPGNKEWSRLTAPEAEQGSAGLRSSSPGAALCSLLQLHVVKARSDSSQSYLTPAQLLRWYCIGAGSTIPGSNQLLGLCDVWHFS